MRRKIVSLVLLAAMTMPGPLAAQVAAVEAAPAEAPAPRPATLLLDMPDGGKAREYQIDEMSIAISRSGDGRGESRGDVTISLGTVRPLDTALLQWSRQGEATSETARRAVITVPAAPDPAASPELRYELEGARVMGFSLSHSAAASMTQVMLQLSVRRITFNGVVMN